MIWDFTNKSKNMKKMDALSRKLCYSTRCKPQLLNIYSVLCTGNIPNFEKGKYDSAELYHTK